MLVGLLALASGAGEGAVADWSAIYLRDTVGTGEAQATLGYAVFSVAMVAMRLVADPLVTRIGPVRMARAAGVCAAAGVLLVTLPVTLPAALAGFALMGFGYATVVPLAFSRAAADPHVPPGQAIASVATLGYGALLLAPPTIGFLSEVTSLRTALMLLAGLAALITLLAPVLRRAPVSLRGAAADAT